MKHRLLDTPFINGNYTQDYFTSFFSLSTNNVHSDESIINVIILISWLYILTQKLFEYFGKNQALGISTYGYLSIEEFEMLYYSLKESNIPIMGRLILLQSHLSGIMELSDKVFSTEEANPEDIPGIDFDKLIKPSTKKWIPEEHGSKSNV